MLGNRHFVRGLSTEIVSVGPWSQWAPTSAAPGPTPQGGVWERRLQQVAMRMSWQHCYGGRDCIWTEHYFANVVTHQVDWRDEPSYICVRMSDEWTTTTTEFRLAYPTDVDSHLTEVLATKGSVIQISPPVSRPDLEGLILVDGEPMKSARFDTVELQAGAHYLDYLESSHGKATQVAVHVIEPVSIVPSQPDIHVVYDPSGTEPNGVVTEVTIRNWTKEQRRVALDILSVPVGWDAFLAADPVLVLEPRSTATCIVQVELMSTIGVRTTVGSIVIGAKTAVSTTRADCDDQPYVAELVATCDIRASVKAPTDVFATVEKMLEFAEL